MRSIKKPAAPEADELADMPLEQRRQLEFEAAREAQRNGSKAAESDDDDEFGPGPTSERGKANWDRLRKAHAEAKAELAKLRGENEEAFSDKALGLDLPDEIQPEEPNPFAEDLPPGASDAVKERWQQAREAFEKNAEALKAARDDARAARDFVEREQAAAQTPEDIQAEEEDNRALAEAEEYMTKNFAPFMPIEGDEKWEQMRQSLIQEGRNIYVGKIAPGDAAKLAFKAAAADQLAHMFRVVRDRLNGQNAMIAKLTATQPGIGSGDMNGKHSARRSESEMTPDDLRAVRESEFASAMSAVGG
jgi:hypothetical protein